MPKTFLVDLSACQTVAHLAVALGVDEGVLRQLAEPDAARFYRKHSIPKKSERRNSEKREVFEPNSDELKQAHKTIHRRLADYASHRDPAFPPACCYGFVRRRSTLENADRHKGNRLLQRADIADFFPSVSRVRAEAALRSIGLSTECADVLARVLCFNGALVPGLSASPMMANLVCRELDARLLTLAKASGATYTRYADDISFSGDAVPPITLIGRALEAEGFALAVKKQRLTKRGQAHFVTGLSIQDPRRPHVPKKMKARLRQELHYCVKYGVLNHLLRTSQKLDGGVNRLDGLVRYVSYIERDTAFDFREAWQRLQVRDDVWPTVPTDHNKPRRPYFVAVDESIFVSKGRRYLALAFALYENEDVVNDAVAEVRDGYLADPFTAGRRAVIAKRGLHHSEAHPQLKAAFVARLPRLPMRVLVGLTEIGEHDGETKTRAYYRVFCWGVESLFLRTDGGELTLRVESAPFVSQDEMRKVVSAYYSLSTFAGKRRPAVEPCLKFVDKSCPAVALPDFMLGVLGAYLEAREKPTAAGDADGVERGHFERVRDRFTLIHDLDTGRYYSRRAPFQADSLDDRSRPTIVRAPVETANAIPMPQALDKQDAGGDPG
ncbi:reverse transcriptase family protein [Tahibacter sp.]|uniref:reverse transcriptase family protein n=1 Tax=Tahibacter sp. TaxID=2056211 RepID=UPI0028C505AC|nr:reverse transcriptase family protein [Tahibacter sp.]